MTKYYKWNFNGDVYCSRVEYIGNSATGCYYKNGSVYALYQPWVLKESDIEIDEKEFNYILKM